MPPISHSPTYSGVRLLREPRRHVSLVYHPSEDMEPVEEESLDSQDTDESTDTESTVELVSVDTDDDDVDDFIPDLDKYDSFYNASKT